MSPRTKTFCIRLGRGRARALLPLIAAAALGAAGCDDPPIDGNTPPPAGVMKGTVSYFGPRPTCDYENGVPVNANGRVILTLFEFDDPPPPEGSATSASNLLAIPGNELFGNLGQVCPPEGTPPDPDERIASSVEFTWPELPLGTSRPIAYRVQGFFDRDESFNPFFNITQSPTADDVAGAAVDDPQSPNPQIAPIFFGTREQYPLGQLVPNVSVTLGLHVDTEPPVFHATSTHLPSETPLRPNTAGTAATEENLLALTDTRLHLYDDLTSGAGLELAEALAMAGLDYDIGPDRPEYAWYVRGVDVDGTPGTDDHPVFFAATVAEFKYLFPIVLLRRRMNGIEIASGVPTVIGMGIVPQNTTAAGPPYTEGQVVFPEIRIGIPPVAIAITNPALGDVCRIPFFAPGTTREVYDDGNGQPRLADCQELPTGRYDYTVLNGVTEGTVVADMASPTGFNIIGGRYSNQNWTAPNALGDPAQFVDRGAGSNAPIPTSCVDSPCAVEQSVTNAFLIYDDTPETYGARRTQDPACATSLNVFAQPVPVPDPSWNEADINAFVDSDPDDEFDDFSEVQAACCEPIAHLCDGLPLCPLIEDPNAPGHSIRSAPTSSTEIDWNGERRERPNCLPFHMPTACCAAVPPTQ